MNFKIIKISELKYTKINRIEFTANEKDHKSYIKINTAIDLIKGKFEKTFKVLWKKVEKI